MNPASRILLSAAILPVALLAGCAATGDVRAGPLQVLAEQERAWNRGDVEAFMEGYLQAADITFSSDQGTIRGWETVLTRYRRRYPDRKAMGKLSFSDLESRPLGPDAALVTGRWRLERERDAPEGNFSLVFTRVDDAWRIVHDHTSAFVDTSGGRRNKQ